MSTVRAVTVKRPKDVRDLILRFGRMIAGQEPDQFGLADTFWSAVAHSLSQSVYTAFLVKAHHGTDELGQKWPDHDPKTKAYSRKDARQGIPLPGPPSRPTLTESQNKVWAYIFASNLAYLRTQMQEGEAKKQAAKMAWSTVKDRFGAKTLLELTQKASIPLLMDSLRLSLSLSPGTFSGRKYTPPNKDQVFRVSSSGSSSRLTWGTSVEYADKVSQKRPFWPDSIDPWMSRALEAGIDAVVQHIKEIL